MDKVSLRQKKCTEILFIYKSLYIFANEILLIQ